MPSQHQYGPYQPEAAPNAVTVLTPAGHSCGRSAGHAPGCVTTRWPVAEVRPLPEALVRQRQELATRAQQQSLLVSRELVEFSAQPAVVAAINAELAEEWAGEVGER